nr:FAD-dependent oxidoreductase [Patulibacter sp. DM4]
MRVCVVGGGVIGLCTAYYLRARGADVTLVERDRCGQATSRGNGGWITPSLSGPIAGPGVILQSLKWMLDPSSPFYIRPRLDPKLAAWCVRFARNCTSARYREGMRVMLEFGERTHELYADLERDGLAFEHERTGLLFVAQSEAGLAEFDREFAVMESLGHDPALRRLSGAELLELEPSLDPSVGFGMLAQREAWVRPESLCGALAERLRSSGVEVREQTAIDRLDRDRGGWRVRAGGETIDCDRLVIAAGVWSLPLLERLGQRIPLQPAKGYSITAHGSGTAPRHALYFAESKVGVTPFAGGVRLSGTLELTGMDDSRDRRRMEAIADGTVRYLRDWRPERRELEWAGLRPYLPDALPAIGPVPGATGAFVATGHGMSGMTLGPATGSAVAQMVLDDVVPRTLLPFQLGRRY